MIEITFGEKLSDVSYNDRAGAYLISVKNGKMAVVETPKGYFLIGGGINTDESHVDCIKREAIEEIGHIVTVKKYICSAEEYITREKRGYFHPIQYYYEGEIGEKTVNPIEMDHVFKWIPIEESESKLFFKSQKWAVKKWMLTQ